MIYRKKTQIKKLEICKDPKQENNFKYKITLQCINHKLLQIFNRGFWLAGSTAASQSEVMLENPC